jgi:hypothetical protein
MSSILRNLLDIYLLYLLWVYLLFYLLLPVPIPIAHNYVLSIFSLNYMQLHIITRFYPKLYAITYNLTTIEIRGFKENFCRDHGL